MPKPKEIIPTEYQEACMFVDWLELQKQAGKILDYCHIANESYGKKREDMLRGRKLKRQGRKRGVFDYQIFIAAGKEIEWMQNIGLERWPVIVGDNGDPIMLCVELKRRTGGKVSPDQKHWQEVYDKCDIPAKVCRGAEEAIDFVERFLE